MPYTGGKYYPGGGEKPFKILAVGRELHIVTVTGVIYAKFKSRNGYFMDAVDRKIATNVFESMMFGYEYAKAEAKAKKL